MNRLGPCFFLLTLMLNLSASARAEQCRFFFNVVESDPHLPGGSISRMSDAQERWWAKRGSKKFLGVCYDPTRATYTIVWWREVVSDNRHITNPSDPRFSATKKGTRDIGYAYVKSVTAADSEKPLFFVDGDSRGTAGALERTVEFLSKLKGTN